MEQMDIAFPHLGIYLKNVPQYIMIGSFPVAMYGIMIALAMLSGLLLASHMAKKTGLNLGHRGLPAGPVCSRRQDLLCHLYVGYV